MLDNLLAEKSGEIRCSVFYVPCTQLPIKTQYGKVPNTQLPKKYWVQSPDPDARHKIGCIEALNDKIERAVKHWIIAANLGQHESMRALKHCYQAGLVSKDDFAATLRAHHAAVNATKSPQRDAAEKANLGQNGLVLGD